MGVAERVDTQGGGHLHKWVVTNADAEGSSVSIIGAADRTVHIYGTFGSATVVLQGTNDEAGSNWITLHDISGAEISATAALIAMVAENPLFIRPFLSGGAASTVNIHVLSRK